MYYNIFMEILKKKNSLSLDCTPTRFDNIKHDINTKKIIKIRHNMKNNMNKILIYEYVKII